MNAHARIDLTLDGYRPGAPSAEAEAIDSDVVGGMRCRKCGGQCYYESFSRQGSYRAFAICLDCGYEEEF